jgi:hypothetical protein
MITRKTVRIKEKGGVGAQILIEEPVRIGLRGRDDRVQRDGGGSLFNSSR